MKHVLILLLFVAGLSEMGRGQTNKKLFFKIPPYFIANAECKITGPFDAIGSNTIIHFENARTGSFTAIPLLESNTEILFKVPDTYGEFELIIVDEGTDAELYIPVRIIDLKMNYDSNVTSKKAVEAFQVQLLGAEKMEATFNISIKNQTPHLINIINGNYQQHTLTSTKDSERVYWEGKFMALTKETFTFSIIGSVTQPTPSRKVPVFDY